MRFVLSLAVLDVNLENVSIVGQIVFLFLHLSMADKITVQAVLNSKIFSTIFNENATNEANSVNKTINWRNPPQSQNSREEPLKSAPCFHKPVKRHALPVIIK